MILNSWVFVQLVFLIEMRTKNNSLHSIDHGTTNWCIDKMAPHRSGAICGKWQCNIADGLICIAIVYLFSGMGETDHALSRVFQSLQEEWTCGDRPRVYNKQ